MLFGSVIIAQHIPPGHDTNHSNPSECRGYAISRAWGKSWGSSCGAHNTSIYSIDETYHSKSSFSYGAATAGKIIAWGNGGANHAAYITSVEWIYGVHTINIAFVEGPGGSQMFATLDDAINGTNGVYPRGTPDYLYTPIKTGWPIKVQNSFDGGADNGGTVKVRGATKNSPYTTNTTWNGYTSIEASMDGQSRNNYKRLFVKWTEDDYLGNKKDFSTSKQTSVKRTDRFKNDQYIYEAEFLKEYNIGLQNNFTGVGNHGQIVFDGSTYNVTHTGYVRENNSVSIGAPWSQTYNSIVYTFSHWTGGASGSTSPKTITPSGHMSITANYNGKPEQVDINPYNGSPGDNITITWPENPNTNVTQYRISRKVKHSLNGSWDPEQTLATVNRGTTSYTDAEYIYTSGYTHDLVYYNVRAYYTIENSWSDNNWVDVFGEGGGFLPKLAASAFAPNGLPTAYRVGNFPNPFNPETNIAFTVANSAKIKLDVFDINGRLVQHLLSESLAPGRYRYRWNSREANGRLMPSGVYFVRMQVIERISGKAQVVSHRLLLMK